MYKLYLDDFITDTTHKKSPSTKRSISKSFFYESTPLKFSLQGKEKNSFKIEEIDSLLCSFKSKEEFIKELRSHNLDYLTPEERTKEDLVLAYTVKGKIKEAMIIFDDKLLFEQATNLRRKKKEASEGDKILTESSERLVNYIRFVKSLALNKTTSNYILCPKNIRYLTFEERDMLDSDFLNSFNTKFGLRYYLGNYVRYKEIEEELLEAGMSTLDVEREVNKANKDIMLFFRSDYRNLRKMIEWESKYKEVLLLCLNKEELSDYEKEIINVQIDSLNLAKKIRNSDTPVEDDLQLLTMDEEYMYNQILNTSEPTLKGFDNLKIAELYVDGGIENVMKNMDLDEILRNPEDAERLGITQKRTK